MIGAALLGWLTGCGPDEPPLLMPAEGAPTHDQASLLDDARSAYTRGLGVPGSMSAAVPGPAPVELWLMDELADRAAVATPFEESHRRAALQHGGYVAGIANDLACHADQCAISLGARRVLRAPESNTDTWGSTSELTAALDALVARKHAAPHTKMVVGLALAAWGTPSEEAGLLDALGRARCADILVFAPTGNRRDAESEDRHMALPARWNDLDASAWPPCSGAHPTSGVWAVGAVDSRGADLSNAIRGVRPSLLAHGSRIPWTRSGEPGPPPRTGTSFGAPAMAAMAAVLWAHRGTWTSDRVVGALYRAGHPLDGGADRPTLGPDARQVRACAVYGTWVSAAMACDDTPR